MSAMMQMMTGAIPTPDFAFNLSAISGTSDLRTLAIAAGWNTVSKVVATIPSPVKVCPTSASGMTGLTISGSFPGGVKLDIASGASLGGSHGAGSVQGVGASNGNPGGNGGLALSVTVACTIDNLGTIAGAGGGGGSGAGALNPDLGVLQGGGGAQGADVNGAAGGQSSGDIGYGGCYAGLGRGGGDLGSDAQAGGPSVSWDLFPGGYSGGAGGLGGGAVSGNSFITWINTGTRIGAIG